MPSAPAPVALGEAGHWGKGTWETLRVWGGRVMTAWASSTGQSSSQIHSPERRGCNHNLNIWSKSREHRVGGGRWRGGSPRRAGATDAGD